MQLSQFLSQEHFTSQPLFHPDLTPGNTFSLDFSSENQSLMQIEFTDSAALNSFVENQIATAGKTYGYGGYLEKRHIYRRGSVFKDESGRYRNIHLGVDIWAPAGTPVFAPLDGFVHSFADNDALGDYGPTIILQHSLSGCSFFTLYGHLSKLSLSNLRPGQLIKAGINFCTLGNSAENGQWPCHLHFQVIGDLMGKSGDFPGVCMEDDLPCFAANCPNPAVFFKNLHLH